MKFSDHEKNMYTQLICKNFQIPTRRRGVTLAIDFSSSASKFNELTGGGFNQYVCFFCIMTPAGIIKNMIVDLKRVSGGFILPFFA